MDPTTFFTVMTGLRRAGFRPTAIGGNILWLSADAAGVADGGLATSWPDLSGNSNNFGAASTVLKPTYNANRKNGRGAMTFDGAQNYMVKNSFAFPANYTILAVVKSTITTQQNVVDADHGAAPRILQFRINGTNMQGIGFDTTPSAFTDSAVITATNWNIVSVVRSASAIETYVNGASDGSTATTGTNNSGSKSVYLGSYDTTTAMFNGDLGEVVMYDSALNSTDLATITNWLNARWAIF